MPKWNIAARRRARRFALQALYQWQFNPEPSGQIIAQFLKQPEMVGVDTDFFTTLVREIMVRYSHLDEAMQPLLEQSMSKLQPAEKAILRIGVFELQNCPETPYRVVVNEAIELAKAFGATGSHRYVNGVLHGVAKQYRSHEI